MVSHEVTTNTMGTAEDMIRLLSKSRRACILYFGAIGGTRVEGPFIAALFPSTPDTRYSAT
jgi:hypothetical protein